MFCVDFKKRYILIICASILYFTMPLFSQGKDKLFVKDPLSFENLVIVPVCLSGPQPDLQVLSLDEGLKSGQVVISEQLGSENSDLLNNFSENPALETNVSPPVNQEQQLNQNIEQIQQMESGGAQVNSLMISNNSDLPLLLLAGETITGGKQDRTIAHDVIIPPGAAEIKLDVFCVEQGRWNAGEKGNVFQSSAILADTTVRESAQMEEEQSQVWSNVEKTSKNIISKYGYADKSGTEISENEARQNTDEVLSLTNESFNYNKNLDNSNFAEKYFASLEKLQAKLTSDKEIVGYIFILDNTIRAADIFVNNSVFLKFRDKLLSSYIIDGLSAAKTNRRNKSRRVLLALADEYLGEVLQLKKNQKKPQQKDGYLLYKIEQKKLKGVEIEYRKLIVHANYFSVSGN